MTAGYADLHSHTTASDGTQPPSVNVRLALAARLAAIAITDHDTVAGVDEAVAEGERLGIRVVPGVEISTVAKGQDIHVLGYYVDCDDRTFLDRLAELRSTRDNRNAMLLDRLTQLGMPITMSELLGNRERARQDESIGRPHIAALMVEKGYVGSIGEAFDRFLGKGGAAYVNPPRLDPQTAISWIHEAGGAAVLAHPGLYDADELIPELIAAGLDGIEAYHSDHTPEQEETYARIADESRLIVTAGSDFHGERHGEMVHAPIGSRKIEASVLERLKKR